jgi:phenylacetate-CoA ligase
VKKALLETLLGPSYVYHRRLIEESKSWTPTQIDEYQRATLARLTRKYGVALTTKDDYRRNLRRYTSWNIPLLEHDVRTGGTSGEPLCFRADTFSRRQKERAYLFDIWGRIGYGPFDPRVVYRGNTHGDLVRFNRLENAWIVSPSATRENQLGELRSWLKTLPPFFLHVYPSSLYTFIDLVGDELFPRLPILGVLAGSEMFPPGEQLRFEENYGIRIAHWYGHSEYAILGRHCRECYGFHFYPTYGYMELLTSDIEDYFRVIASSYNHFGTHFVRYDTGDLATATRDNCEVDQFPRVASIAGRAQETFTDNFGRRRSLGPYVFGIHGRFWDHVRDLQIVQEEAGHLRVRVVTTPAADKGIIEQTLVSRMPMVNLQFEYPVQIARGPSGKRQYLGNHSGLRTSASARSAGGTRIAGEVE